MDCEVKLPEIWDEASPCRARTHAPHALQGIDNPVQRKVWSNLRIVSVRVLRSLENLLEELDAKYHCVETVEIMLSLNGARASFGMAQVGATYKPNKKAKHAEPKA
jgi:hypothetical protein